MVSMVALPLEAMLALVALNSPDERHSENEKQRLKFKAL